ncbi:right-handed parallel beta-helix repeat-containing protein [Reichenbachiella ulvae]|uniref:Right-handed parallel beta-helix repeat-containing protein n=1 Tax=Reichenbachiella ulvae TaxID=2980104 RepID=A0ABT3CX19_9BACT|nr:right-handed parallel beta-helix repeat-containing protein [Reichenbachiella ulvae]MCV9388250.1 right-handed parallel beta-helix repeat-containing protein [Reichenbachiella ulvae]
MKRIHLIVPAALLVLSLLSHCSSDVGGTTPEPEIERPPVSDVACSDCDFVIEPGVGMIDGEKLGIQPGQVIGLSGSGENYQNITFTNIVGTEADPIIIRNCDGKAIIESYYAFGVKFTHSEHFRLLGDGDVASDYGIQISTSKGFFLTLEQFTTDFDISLVEIAGYEPRGIGENNGFAGIGIKTSPYQACDVFTDPTRSAWIMKNVSVSHCYIHDTGGEGLYIGHGFYEGRVESACSETTYSHSIQHIRIHDNRIEDVGFDGIQIKNCDKDCKVFNNVIRNYGQLDEGAHNEGLFIGDGTTGEFYGNYIINGTGHGIQFYGIGNNDIYNNLIVNAGNGPDKKGDGFYAANAVRWEDGYFNVMNNTFINSGRNGLAFFGVDGGVKRFYNNIFAVTGAELSRKGVAMDSANNIFTQNLESLHFSNPDKEDYSLQDGSRALDAGADVSMYGIDVDILGQSRPVGTAYDVGAYEKR